MPLAADVTTDLRSLPSRELAGDGGTGSTRNWMVFGKRPRTAWPLAALAAFGGLAMGAIGVLLVVPLARAPDVDARAPAAELAANVEPDVEPAPAMAAPVVIAPVEPAVEAALEPAVEPAVEPAHEPAVEPTEPGASVGGAEERRERRGERRRARKAVAAPASEQPKWLAWSEAQKLAALESCTKVCARSIRAIKKKGEPVQPMILDGCVDTCTRR